MNSDNNLEKLSRLKNPEASANSVDISAAVDVMATQAEISGEIADLGIEDGEAFGEEENQSKGKHSHGTGQGAASADPKSHTHPLPQSVVMQKEIAEEIRKEIRQDERKVLLAYVGVRKMPPHKLAELVARIRSLKDVLASLISATKEALTSLYLKWVRKEV